MESKFINTNHICLHYLDNEADGPIIILLHGLTANAHAFDGLLAVGLGNNFRIISVDLRGRGLSDQPETGYTMKEHSADIIGLMGSLQIDRARIIGHSFGAFLGVYLAVYFPDRIEQLILLDAAVSMHPNTKEMLGPALSRLEQTFSSFEVYLNKVKTAPYLTSWDENMRSYYYADVKENSDGTITIRSKLAHMMEAVMKGSLGEPWAKLIKLVHIPCLLINAPGVYTMGAALLPKELALETVNMMNDCTYRQVAGNHQTMLYGNGALQIVAAIKKFIAK